MKKIIFVTILLFNFSVVSGQEWSSWVTSNCTKGIKGSAKNYGYNKYGKGYEWNWKIKNTYSKTVTFDLYFQVGNDKKSWGVFTLAPNEERTHVSFYYSHPSSNFLITVDNVFFGTLSESQSTRCWAECDNGTAICNPKKNESSSNNSTNENTNESTNNQNAAAERQQQAQNAYNERIRQDQERQNREIANKRQQYDSAYNSGVNAYNSRNYSEAKTQFANAIDLANSEQERTPAQNNYNKCDDAINSETKAKAFNDAGNIILTGLDAIMQANKADKERKRLEQQQAVRTRQIEEQRIVDANQHQNNDWQTALNYAKDNTKFGFEKAIAIMLPYANDFKLNGMALNSLGYWYWMLKDFKNAFMSYYSSMYKKDPDGTRNLGAMFYAGQYTLQDKGTALEYFQKACLLGNQVGCDAYNETKKELEENNKSTERDFIGLAKSYLVDKNYVKAVDYYTKAYEKATANKWIIPSLIAEIYFDPKQLNDRSNASKWFEIATIKIESDAVKKNSIGTNDYLDMEYVKYLFKYATCMKDVDGQIAINSFQKSVREKYFEGLLETAKIYQVGNGGVEPDWSQAKICYEKAAEKKSVPAMFFLGQLYETGGPKLDKSKQDSRKWFKMACKADKNYCK